MPSTKKAKPHKSLTLADVKELGAILLKTSDAYPLQYRTERDFFPLVRVFLEGRVPSVEPEVGNSNKKIDFRIGGTNPAVVELAVAPRALCDANCPGINFSGHKQTSQLYASTNKTEVQKLGKVPQTQAKNRYLLLLDLGKGDAGDNLKILYETSYPKNGTLAAIRVVYVGRDNNSVRDFQIGGQAKGVKQK